MKKIILFACIMIAATISLDASAQSKSSVKFQPKFASAQQQVDYYYLPDIDSYYYVPGKQFIYQTNGHWTFCSTLPAAKRVDFASANKVAVNEPGAYRFNVQHKAKYASAKASVITTDKSSLNKKAKIETAEEKAGG